MPHNDVATVRAERDREKGIQDRAPFDGFFAIFFFGVRLGGESSQIWRAPLSDARKLHQLKLAINGAGALKRLKVTLRQRSP